MADGPDTRDFGPSRTGGRARHACRYRVGSGRKHPAVGLVEEGEEVVMKAQVGDRLVPDGDLRRVGVIIGLRNTDGSPPYVVKWVSGGHIALVFPGPYTRVIRYGAARS
jgi:hypothetical protein